MWLWLISSVDVCSSVHQKLSNCTCISLYSGLKRILPYVHPYTDWPLKCWNYLRLYAYLLWLKYLYRDTCCVTCEMARPTWPWEFPNGNTMLWQKCLKVFSNLVLGINRCSSILHHFHQGCPAMFFCQITCSHLILSDKYHRQVHCILTTLGT